MISITAGLLAKIVKGDLAAGSDSTACKGVSIDSRTIFPLQAFFAVTGANFDGHHFVQAAMEAGASCAVVEYAVDSAVPQIVVENTVVALGRLAAWYRRQIPAKVIAVTGSVGKTSTRQILYHVLSRRFRCRQAVKSFNNHIGVPLTILSADAQDEILLLELGTNHPGEIKYLTEIARPDAALITFIGPAHLEGFKTQQNILVEKASIAEGLSPEGVLYLNGDQPELADYARSRYDVAVVTFGTNSHCDIIAEQMLFHNQSGQVTVEGQTINVPLAGRGNLMNVLGSWAVCRDTGMDMSAFAEAVATVAGVEKRLEIRQIGTLIVLDDCYNANPVSMANALDLLSHMKTASGGRKVFIAGSMRELGEESAKLHRELGHRIADSDVRLLLACGPYAEELAAGAARTGRENLHVQCFGGTAQLCDNLYKWIQNDDIILVKGSRSERMEAVVDRLRDLDPTK